MFSYLLVIVILAYLSLVGIAAASLVDMRISRPALLTSPMVGLGVLLPVVLGFSRAGLAVGTFATALVVMLGIAAAGVLVWRRPAIPTATARYIWIPLAAGLLLAGAPMLLFDLHWAGNSNGDMTMYVSSALGFLHHGFFQVPSLSSLLSNVESGWNMWFWEVMPPNRYGADVFIATVAAVFRLSPISVYMACAVASFGALILATAALCDTATTRARIFIGATVMAVGMPIMLYAVYQQILPQLMGQAAMVAFVALAQAGDADRRARIQRGTLLGATLAALMLVYPEISPLLVLGWAVLLPFTIAKHRVELVLFARKVAEGSAIAAAAVLVLLNVQIFTWFSTMIVLFRIGGDVSTRGVGTINYYLVPSGIANLWGLVPFDNYPEPWLSLAIPLGFIALVAVTIAALYALRKAKFSSAMLVGILAMLVLLFFKRSSYGLFKMAFLVQPFLVPFVVSAIARTAALLGERARIEPKVAMAAVAAVCLFATSLSTYVYLGSTSDLLSKQTAQFTELYQASKDDLYGQIAEIERSYGDKDASTPFMTDASFQNLAEAEGDILRGHPMAYEATDPFSGMYGAADVASLRPIIGWPAGSRDLALRTAKRRTAVFKRVHVKLGSESVETYVPPAVTSLGLERGALIETGPNLSVLNRYHADRFDVRAVPMSAVKNWLTLVDSELGAPPESRPATAIGAVEPDPFNRGNTLTTVGKSMLLEVVKPSKTVRLRLALTATFNPSPYFDIPDITLVGATTVRIPSPGAGMAQLLTPPVQPLSFRGHKYVALKFGNRLYKYPTHRTWLTALFGTDIDVDPRQFALHARDISVQQQPRPSPSTISHFPQDLLDPELRYSGVYEDGWLGKRFEVYLRSRSASDVLRLHLNVPPGDSDKNVTVTVDGRKLGAFRVTPAHYVDVRLRGAGAGEHRIVLQSSSVGRYLHQDDRPTWAQIMDLGFVSGS